jgi:hypothetical protein
MKMYPTNSRFKWFVAIVSFIFLGAFMVGGYSLVRLGIENAPLVAIESGAGEASAETGSSENYGVRPYYGWGFGRVLFGLFAFFILFKLFTLPLRMFFWGRRGWGHHGHHRGHWGPPWKQGPQGGPGKWVWVEEEKAEPAAAE